MLHDSSFSHFCMQANDLAGNSDKSLVSNGVNEKSGWIKIIQLYIPQYDEYEKCD